MANDVTVKKHLSDVIDLGRDILPYRMVQIIAGVGAGKNYWVNQLARMIRPNDVNPFSVLLITSRAATANAQAEKIGASRWLDFNKIYEIDRGIGCIRGVERKYIVTNSGIEQFIKKSYAPDDEETHIWNKFDFIILDEAHSLATDAVFADSPFYVHQFLRQAIHQNPSCHVILMTGTPAPIDWLITEELKNHAKFNQLNVFDECVHVVPKRVILEPLSSALFDTIEELKRGKKILYFAKTVKRIKSIYDALCEDTSLQKLGITSKNICISFAESQQNFDKAKNEYGFSDDDLVRLKNVRKGLIEKALLPDDTKILITTSTLKEGVDINNDDMRVIFAESVVPADLMQMAGRLRNGVDDLRILYPSYKTFSNYKEIDYQTYTERFCLEQINAAYIEYYKKRLDRLDENITNSERYLCTLLHEIIDRSGIITYVHKTFQNIRYDYFTDSFVWYYGREKGNEFNLKCVMDILKSIQYWNKEWQACDEKTGEEYNYSIKAFFRRNFPESEIVLWNKNQVSQYIKELIFASGYWNVEITRAQRDDLIKGIISKVDIELWEKILGSKEVQALKGKKTPSQPKSFFKNCLIDIQEVPGKRKGSAYIISDLPFDGASEDDDFEDT